MSGNLRINNALWIISDTHFGHANIIKFQQRPVNHEVIMLDNWISRVPEDHQLLHLGDVWMKSNISRWAKVISRMPGQKFLIRGNHDKSQLELYESAGFVIVEPFIHNQVLFSHEPFADYLLPDSTDPTARRRFPRDVLSAPWHTNIHGHTHGNDHHAGDGERDAVKRYINVCVELTDYAPVQLGNLLK